MNEGIRVGGLLIRTVPFADDHVTLANSVKGLQLMMDKMQETEEEYGIEEYVKKTKVMKISKRPGEEFAIFLVEGKQFSQESHFNYLGSLITQDGSLEKEIRSRIARTKNAFTKRKELRTKAFSLCLETRITLIKECNLEYSSLWSRIVDLIERGLRWLESCEIWL